MITPALFLAPDDVRLTTFSRRERRALRALRARFRQDRDVFGAHEVARLRFVRWLYRSGRLVPQPHTLRCPASCLWHMAVPGRVPLEVRIMLHPEDVTSDQCYGTRRHRCEREGGGLCLPNVYAW